MASYAENVSIWWRHHVFPHFLVRRLYYYTPRTIKLLGVYWFHSLRPSVCPSVRPTSCVRSVAPKVLVGFFHIYTSYQATSEGVSHVKFLAKFQNLNFWQCFKIYNFDFVLFWLGIWCESLIWIIGPRHGAAGGISECRRSSCSNLVLIKILLKFFHGSYWR